MKLLFVLSLFFLAACEASGPSETPVESAGVEITHFDAVDGDVEVERGQSYSTAPEVALYIYAFDQLPINYRTKSEAESLGWVPSEGNLREVCDECLIGGDRFMNFEGLLPEIHEPYYEADVNYEEGYRGAERLVFTNDPIVYYTDDHYDSFELWYGEE